MRRSQFFNIKRRGGKDTINSEMMMFPLEKKEGSQLDLLKTSKPSVGKKHLHPAGLGRCAYVNI